MQINSHLATKDYKINGTKISRGFVFSFSVLYADALRRGHLPFLRDPMNNSFQASDKQTDTQSAKTSTRKNTAKLSASDQRYLRYKRIVDWVLEKSDFELDQLKAALATDEKPAFVTKVVNDLEQSGFIIREHEAATGYRWNPGKPFASCLLYTSPSPRDRTRSRMPSSA